jgi:hypothetical protein
VTAVLVTRDNHVNLINGVSQVLATTGGLKAIEQGVNHFLEGSAILIKGLNEVAELHPFVKGAPREIIFDRVISSDTSAYVVAVMAFKV